MPLYEYERYLRVPELLCLQTPEEARTHADDDLEAGRAVPTLWRARQALSIDFVPRELET